MNHKLEIDNFNLGLFISLIEESIAVTPELMLEFKDGMIKACSFSNTKTLIKLWTLPVAKFIVDTSNELDVVNEALPVNIPVAFDFYVFNGTAFLKYLSVFSKSSVNISIEIGLGNNNKMQAKFMAINGLSNNGSHKLSTKLELTTDDFLTNTVSDYNEILQQCTPDKDMFEFAINSKQIYEIKSLIKNLHKSQADNTSYLTFKIADNKITVSDKVFTISLDTNYVGEEIEFLMLKSNFALLAHHDYLFYTNNIQNRIVIVTEAKSALIGYTITKYKMVKSINDDLEKEDAEFLQEYIDAVDLDFLD